MKIRSLVNVPSILSKQIYRQNHASVKSAVKETNNVSPQPKSVKEIPGPPSLPLIGPLHHFLAGGVLADSYGMKLLRKLNNTYGPIVKLDSIFGSPTVIIVFDPDAIAHLLHSENWLPSRPGFPTLEYYRKYYKKDQQQMHQRTGLITDDGEVWKEFRSKVNPVMMQPKTIKLYNTVIDEVALDMIKRLKSIRNDKNMIPDKFDTEMNLWALESIAAVALGGRLNCLSADLAEESPERQLVQCVHDVFTMSEKLDWQPSLWRYYSTRKFKKAMKLYQKHEMLAKHFVNKAKIELNNRSDQSAGEKSILEKLLEMDEEIATIMACDMLFAGVDTAANTMCATLYLLATNPEKQNKLREELTVTGQVKTPYLKACIKEAMRMMPVTGGNLRMLTKTYDNMLGYNLPQGLMVSFPHSYLSMSENHFPKPDEYIPERWIVEKDHPMYYGNAHPFAFNPFGFGVRSCIGRRIAELEVETFLRRIIQNFKLEWVGPPPNVKVTTLNYVTGPFNYVFKDI